MLSSKGQQKNRVPKGQSRWLRTVQRDRILSPAIWRKHKRRKQKAGESNPTGQG